MTQKRRSARVWAKVAVVFPFFFLCTVGRGLGGQIDFGTYIYLEKGMSEGEVLIRAGTPDKEIYFDSEAQRTAKTIKQLLYLPEPGETDPHLTVISIQKGRVIEIERTKIFSPIRKTIGGQIEHETYNLLAIGMSEGEVLIRAGLPDKEVLIGSEKEAPNESIRQLLYIPRPGEVDPHLTIITVKKGKVISLERTKIFN